MPIVPTYDGPQLKQAAVEGGMQRVEDVSSGSQQLAKGLDDAAAIVDKIDYSQSLSAANAAEAKTREDWAQQDQVLRNTLRGSRAGEYIPAAQKWWDDRKTQLGEALTPRARGLMDKSLGVARAQAFHSGAAWVNQEEDRAQVNDYTANIATIIQTPLAAVSSTGAAALPQVAAAELLIREKNAQFGVSRGWTPEMTAQQNLKDLTELNKNTVYQLMSRDPMAAQAYWDKLDKTTQFDSRQVDEVDQKLKATVSTSFGVAEGRAAFAAAVGDKRDATYDPFKMVQEFAKKVEGKPNAEKMIDGFRTSVNEQASLYKSSQDQYLAGNIKPVYDAFNKGVPLSQIKNMEAYRNLSPEKQKLVDDDVMNTREHRTTQQQRMFDLSRAPAAVTYSDPRVLAQMTEAQIDGLRPELGERHWGEVKKKWGDWKNDQSKLSEAKMDADSFDSIALANGLETKPKSTDKEGWGKLKYLHDNVEAEISKRQVKENRVLPRKEKEEIMQQEISKEVITPRYLYLFGGNPVKQATISPQQQGDYNVKVQLPDENHPGQFVEREISPKAIPTKDLANVKASLQRRGLANTDADVVREWADLQRELSSKKPAPSLVNQIPR